MGNTVAATSKDQPLQACDRNYNGAPDEPHLQPAHPPKGNEHSFAPHRVLFLRGHQSVLVVPMTTSQMQRKLATPKEAVAFVQSVQLPRDSDTAPKARGSIDPSAEKPSHAPAAPNKMRSIQGESATVPDATANLRPDRPSATLDGANLVACVAGLDVQSRQDVINSLLLAQLVADQAHDRDQDMEAWYDRYCDVLGNVGWACGSFQFQQHNLHGTKANMQTLVLEVLATIATQDHLAAAKLALDALAKKAERGDRDFQVWNNATQKDGINVFQMSICKGEGATIGLQSAALRVHTQKEDARFLWAGQTRTILQVQAASMNMLLDSTTYSAVRSLVIKKLGHRLAHNLTNLDLA